MTDISQAPPGPSVLATARFIDDIGHVPYPEGIKSPKAELNVEVKDGKFRYDRDFLLQFMAICREKPVMLPLEALEALGLIPQYYPIAHSGRRLKNDAKVIGYKLTGVEWKKTNTFDPDYLEMVDREVKGLLDMLSPGNFDSVSDQIIIWANESEKEKDGRTLIQVIRLIFEKVADEATRSEMYACLCRKMMEQISLKVSNHSNSTNNPRPKPVVGGQLFQRLLLNRCRKNLERSWATQKATATVAATKALEDQVAKASREKSKEQDIEDEIGLYSDEYFAAQRAKRHGLGLIKFIGELFKLQMLTKQIMHQCIEKLLVNVENPEEEEIESLCKLLTTVGAILDTSKARAQMDVYFSRMKELTKSTNVSSRMQFMLQDVIEFRERRWATRNVISAPTTIAQIHELAAEKAASDKESDKRQMSMSRGRSRRGKDRGGDYQQVGPDGWTVASGSGPPRPPAKAGDLSNFGKIKKAAPMTFGPSNIFTSKKEGERHHVSRSTSRFSSADPEAVNAAHTRTSRVTSRKASSDLGQAGIPEAPAQRKRLVLKPRPVPVEGDAA